MTRENLLRRHFTRDMRLLEIGPSYNPVLAKQDGWNTIVVDHASQTDLVAKYHPLGTAMVDRIEPVDFIWTDGPLADAIPATLHGTFDGLVASHVAEHFPDLIGFFQSASALLKPDGVMALALPDKRVCFDYFQPLSMTGDVLAAHVERRTRHQSRTLFNQAAYQVTREGRLGWQHSDSSSPFALLTGFAALRAWHAEMQAPAPASEYRDSHAWVFTPNSFSLLMLELNLLGDIDWTIRSVEPAPAVEFYAWLDRKRLAMAPEHVDAQRLSLLIAIVREIAGAAEQLIGVPRPDPWPSGVQALSGSGARRDLVNAQGRMQALAARLRPAWRAVVRRTAR